MAQDRSSSLLTPLLGTVLAENNTAFRERLLRIVLGARAGLGKRDLPDMATRQYVRNIPPDCQRHGLELAAPFELAIGPDTKRTTAMRYRLIAIPHSTYEVAHLSLLYHMSAWLPQPAHVSAISQGPLGFCYVEGLHGVRQCFCAGPPEGTDSSSLSHTRSLRPARASQMAARTPREPRCHRDESAYS